MKMELKSLRDKVQLNPELEALRIKGLKENITETNDWILQMIDRTSRIHAGFLFEDRKTLQNLCLFIGESQNKITDAGWETFGYHLGLSPSVLKVINHNNFNKEDPCYNIFLTYVQYENSSIGKIIKALYDIGRIDVLSRIQSSINSLANIILQQNFNSIEETSDYESLTSSEENNSSCSSTNFDYLNGVLITPKVIPPAPFIFQNIQATPEITSQPIQQTLGNVLLNVIPNSNIKEIQKNCNNVTEKINCIDCTSNFLENNAKQISETIESKSISSYYHEKSYEAPKRKNYSLKILLTFAEDGEKCAAEICRIFRRQRENFSNIGVLVLSEHADKVNEDPHLFISGAFSQVDYVCPVLTSGYIDLITKKQKVSSISNMHIDAVFVPYIYRLMNTYFMGNDCLNDKIRSIISEEVFSLAQYKYVLGNPIFGAWVKVCEVNELALRLLKSKKKFVN